MVSPDGADVYTSGFENNEGETGTIAEFARNGDGSLSQLASPNNCIETPDADDGCGSSAVGVTGVSGFAISPDGQNVYTASEFEGGPIAEFARNGDGSLTQLASPNNCIEEAGSEPRLRQLGAGHRQRLGAEGQPGRPRRLRSRAHLRML